MAGLHKLLEEHGVQARDALHDQTQIANCENGRGMLFLKPHGIGHGSASSLLRGVCSMGLELAALVPVAESGFKAAGCVSQ